MPGTTQSVVSFHHNSRRSRACSSLTPEGVMNWPIAPLVFNRGKAGKPYPSIHHGRKGICSPVGACLGSTWTQGYGHFLDASERRICLRRHCSQYCAIRCDGLDTGESNWRDRVFSLSISGLLLTPALLMVAFRGAVWKMQRKNEEVLGLDAAGASIHRWPFRDGRGHRE